MSPIEGHELGEATRRAATVDLVNIVHPGKIGQSLRQIAISNTAMADCPLIVIVMEEVADDVATNLSGRVHYGSRLPPRNTDCEIARTNPANPALGDSIFSFKNLHCTYMDVTNS